MTNFLGIDAEVWVIILTIIIAIETLYLIIQERKKSSSGIEPVTADLFKEMLEKIPPTKASEEDYSKLVEEKADEKIESIRSEISREIEAKISEISRKSRKTDAEIAEIKNNMQYILNRAIAESRYVEKDTELNTLKNRILLGLLDQEGQKVRDVYETQVWVLLEKPSMIDMKKALFELEIEQLITIKTEELHRTIHLTPKGIEKAKEIEPLIHQVRYPRV